MYPIFIDAMPVYLQRFRVHFLYWMRRRGLSQLEIAEQLGIDPTSVSCWSRGKNFPNLATLYRLCEEVFHIEVWRFFRRPERRRAIHSVSSSSQALAR